MKWNTEAEGEVIDAVGQLEARGYSRREIAAALIVAGGFLLANTTETTAIQAAIREAADALDHNQVEKP